MPYTQNARRQHGEVHFIQPQNQCSHVLTTRELWLPQLCGPLTLRICIGLRVIIGKNRENLRRSSLRRLVQTVVVPTHFLITIQVPDAICSHTYLLCQIAMAKRKKEKVERAKRKLALSHDNNKSKKSVFKKKQSKRRRSQQNKKSSEGTVQVNHLACCPLSNDEIEKLLKVHDMKYSESLRSQLQVSKNTVYRYIRRIKSSLTALLGTRGGHWKLKPEVEKQIGEATRSHNIKNFDAMAQTCQMLETERRRKAFKKESKRTSQRYFHFHHTYTLIITCISHLQSTSETEYFDCKGDGSNRGQETGLRRPAYIHNLRWMYSGSVL